MMTSTEVSASPYGAQWQCIDWRVIEQKVSKLQVSIAKVTLVVTG
ncbi:hypothetical protein [Shewanella benthica]|nr:hypothetical protein [Shewanella benthica]